MIRVNHKRALKKIIFCFAPVLQLKAHTEHCSIKVKKKVAEFYLEHKKKINFLLDRVGL